MVTVRGRAFECHPPEEFLNLGDYFVELWLVLKWASLEMGASFLHRLPTTLSALAVKGDPNPRRCPVAIGCWVK